MEPKIGKKVNSSLYTKPIFWFFLTFLSVGLILMVLWYYAPTLNLMIFFIVFSIFSLFGGGWAFGYNNIDKRQLELLRIAIAESYNGYLISDSGGQIEYYNLAFCDLLSFEMTKIAQKEISSLNSIIECIQKDQQRIVSELIGKVQLGAPDHVEFKRDSDKGSVRWCRLEGVPIVKKNGKIIGSFFRLIDITSDFYIRDSKRLETMRVLDMLESLPIGFFSADREGILRYVNKTLARWLGIPPDRLLGKPFADYVADVGGEADLTLRDSEGRLFPVALEQSQKDAADGGVEYTRSIVIRDLVWNEVKRTRHNLEHDGESTLDPTLFDVESVGSSAKWLFEKAPVGIVLLDPNGIVTRCNRAFLQLIGSHSSDVVGAPFVNLLAKEDRDDISTNFSKILMGISRGAQLEIQLPSVREKELITALYVSLMTDENREVSGMVLHLIDVTEQRNLEVQFSQSQKMQAVGQLAGGVAHDFNNLLTAMIGFSDLLLTRHGPDDPSFSDIQQIRQNAHRATNLVRQLLAFSRKQKLQLVRLDIMDVLNDLSNLLRRLIGEKVELIMEPASGIHCIQADRGQFDQVMINLIVNARDAMPGGGTVTIRTTNTKFEEPVHRGHDLMPAGKYVLVEVIDTGEGIPKENLEHIFEPFFSTKDVGSGTGLGLSTVYGIVHQSGGYIFVDSAPGEGTKFNLFFPENPQLKEDEVDLNLNTISDKAFDGGVEQKLLEADLTGDAVVLLVEDEDAVRIFAKRALENKGYTVLTADNGERALDVINGTDLKIDIIVSDVVMPGMDGNTLVGIVRHEIPTIKVILMSGYAEDIFHNEIGRDETIHFLGKPFTLRDLAAKVKEVLETQEL